MKPSDDPQVPEKIGQHVTIFQRGGRWSANFQSQGQQVCRSFRTGNKKEARRKAIQIEADLAAGRFTEQKRAPSLSSVIDLYRKYLETEGRAAKTLAKYEFAFHAFVELAERRKVKTILGVDQTFVDAFRAERVENGGAPKTVHADTVILRQVVNFARSRRLVTRDPLHGFKLQKPKSRPQPCWTIAEVQRILAAASEQRRPELTLLAETGMRVGELRHLMWNDIDFDNGVIHIRAKQDWKPKSGDDRVVPMSETSRTALSRLLRKANWVFTSPASSVFRKGDHQLCERRLPEYLKRILKKLQLPGHLHTFRHAFISAALTKGVPEAVVRNWVGHVDQEVMRRYTHIADSVSQTAMADLSAAKAVPKELQAGASSASKID